MANRKRKALLAVLVLALVATLVWWLTRPATPPNVILVSIDTLRADHLGCYGYTRNTSPALDRLAREGALFDTVISSTSWTLPAHAALFTSLPDSVHGCDSERRWLDGNRYTVAEAFRKAGYRTAGFYSGPLLHRYFGLNQGFDTWTECTTYRDRIDKILRTWNYDKSIEARITFDSTNAIVFEAVRTWLADPPEGPFFLFIHLFDVHYVYNPPKPYDTMFRAGLPEEPTPGSAEDLEARYDGEIRWTDDTLGKIFAELKSRGLMDRSVVAVTSDHGEAFFERGHRGHRQSLHDEEVRIPLIIRYPPRIAAATRVSRLASIIDVAPTLLDLAGLPALPDAHGRSFAPLVVSTDPTWEDRPVISEFLDSRQVLALRTPGWKLIFDFVRGIPQVYDLTVDPGERSPLPLERTPVPAGEIRAILEQTVRRLKEAAARMPVPEGRDWMSLPEVHRRHLKSLGYLK